ncbi:MAG TPA: hypothetical protein VEC02_06685 [Nitrososphaerales archaeon]|nr:hypothetical protein [Nitrososphaerales archaeon]
MFFDAGIFLAASGITTLELVEAAAVGLALYADSGKASAFIYVAAGVLVVLVPTILVGGLVSALPELYVRLFGGVLLLYFGLRLTRSARRSVVISKTTGFRSEAFEKGVMYTGFSVGAVEAFEAAIVLVGLLPENFASAGIGIMVGTVIVVISTYVLKTQVRKVKQANMKVVVAGLLLSFSTFWFGETVFPLLSEQQASDLVLIPLFAVFASSVYWFANRRVTAVHPGPKEQQ